MILATGQFDLKTNGAVLGSKPLVLAGILLAMLQTGRAEEGLLSFNRDIRPILAEHCLHCHGPDGNKRKGDLRLDLETEAKREAIREGNPDHSPFYLRLITEDLDERMPPPDDGNRLSASDQNTLKRWIEQGAPYEGHWAFMPIRKPEVPVITDTSLTDIDRFIVSKLQKEGLQLSPSVDRQQWIRRVTFDLTGLPPTWAEVASFLKDYSLDAYEKVVERLLESPRYGERWGRHWLDIARYADTHGGSAIGFTKFPFSYTYRDYVIQAFNDDLPYNRFIKEQLAADQLGLKETDPALAALGFLTIGQRFRTRHDIIDDQIDVVTRGLMGLTATCSRCHDHKFDNIPTTDYYALYATFASSHEPELLPLIGEPQPSEAYTDYEDKLHDLQQTYGDLAREQSDVMRGRLRMQVGAFLKELAKGTPEQDLSVSFLSFRTDDIRPHVLERWRKYLATMDASDPVFGPWKQLSQVDSREFNDQLASKLKTWEEENGDLTKATPQQNLGATAPKWNPKILEAIKEIKPDSLESLADVYGKVFANTHREWLQARVQAAEEALPGADVIPDQDARHLTINSAILRQLRRHLYTPDTPTALPDNEASRLLNRTVSDNLGGRRGAIHNLHLTAAGSPPRSMALTEPKPEEDEAYYVFRRGNPLDKGDRVQPRFLTALSQGKPKIFSPGTRRLHLAESVVHPDNPLTRRVLVNWVWRNHFGKGLVRTPDDFGTRGDPPTHPELLDYLAETFREEGWSIKQLHRRIVLSKTYRQGSIENETSRNKDPHNQLLWRMPRQRLSLESMRDAMLQASGELDLSMGGRPFDMMTARITPRRSVYGFVNRDVPSPLLTTFDGANPSACTAKRPETTVPQQTLFALNSAFMLDRAEALVQRREVQSAESNEDKIRVLYQRTLSRWPDPEEMRAALDHVEQWKEISETDPWPRLAQALLASNEFNFVD